MVWMDCLGIIKQYNSISDSRNIGTVLHQLATLIKMQLTTLEDRATPSLPNMEARIVHLPASLEN